MVVQETKRKNCIIESSAASFTSVLYFVIHYFCFKTFPRYWAYESLLIIKIVEHQVDLNILT
jgi:hypothetical protein